jgi:hypothetical protein
MRSWLAVCAMTILVQGCGGQVQNTDPSEEQDADAALTSDGGVEDGKPPPVTLPNGCVLCNDDALCNYCLVQMSDTTWRCPMSAEAPSSTCWGVGESHTAGSYTFTCYYC